ncbi:MAG: GxxExxY protein [Verrucomicrobia bacterium]|nr:GxxExxY protein [Verrucomicrobiota bacterium]
MSESILYKNEVFQIIGACMAVHTEKGNGFVEPVYQDCMEIELAHLGIPFDPQRNFPVFHRDIQLKHTYTPDLLCFDKIIVEFKAAKTLTDEHRAQVINYLKVTGLELGLLVNFGSHGRLEWERIVKTKEINREER